MGLEFRSRVRVRRHLRHLPQQLLRLGRRELGDGDREWLLTRHAEHPAAGVVVAVVVVVVVVLVAVVV